MKKFILRRDFAFRHAGVAALFVAVGLWFGYDGLIRYPRTSAHDLYVEIEKSEPKDMPEQEAYLEAFKKQKIQSQYGFLVLFVLAGLGVGAHLAFVARFKGAYDEQGFEVNGQKFAYREVEGVDDAQWEKKGITRVTLPKNTITFDNWHFEGVREFHDILVKALRK